MVKLCRGGWLLNVHPHILELEQEELGRGHDYPYPDSDVDDGYETDESWELAVRDVYMMRNVLNGGDVVHMDYGMLYDEIIDLTLRERRRKRAQIEKQPGETIDQAFHKRNKNKLDHC